MQMRAETRITRRGGFQLPAAGTLIEARRVQKNAGVEVECYLPK